jgi:hypothetical protein
MKPSKKTTALTLSHLGSASDVLTLVRPVGFHRYRPAESVAAPFDGSDDAMLVGVLTGQEISAVADEGGRVHVGLLGQRR